MQQQPGEAHEVPGSRSAPRFNPRSTRSVAEPGATINRCYDANAPERAQVSTAGCGDSVVTRPSTVRAFPAGPGMPAGTEHRQTSPTQENAHA